MKLQKKGILLIEDFNKKYYPEKKVIEKTIEKPKIITKTIVEYKEFKELDSVELKKLSLSVVYYLLEAMEKEFEELSKEKALKLETIAEKIIKKVRKF